MEEPKGWHSRGYLPHFDAPDLVQTVTFRLADSLPAHVVKMLTDDPLGNNKLETLLDNGSGACWLRDPVLARLVEDALLHFDGNRYRLLSWCVMPNHVHVMLEVTDGHQLGAIVASWKQFTARLADRRLERSGPFWQLDYFDRFVRDAGHYDAALHYIEENPVKAGLTNDRANWRWSSAWRRTPK